MGQEYSHPRPGTPLQVIGLGLPRTGTSSLSAALAVLLDGPVYHGGTQVVRGPETDVRSLTKVLNQWPPKDITTDEENKAIIRNLLDGYAAVQDVAPLYAYVRELPEMYPDAIFICSVRDVESWEKSMLGLSNSSIPLLITLLRFILLPIPTLRLFPGFIAAVRRLMGTLFGEDDVPTRKTWEAHRRLLEENIPKDRLVFVSVKDGWEPLCKALGEPVPAGVPFPRINDAKAMDDFAKDAMCKGLLRWALAIATGGAAAYAYRKL